VESRGQNQDLNQILTFWVEDQKKDHRTSSTIEQPGQPARLCGVWTKFCPALQRLWFTVKLEELSSPPQLSNPSSTTPTLVILRCRPLAPKDLCTGRNAGFRGCEKTLLGVGDFPKRIKQFAEKHTIRIRASHFSDAVTLQKSS
jgi:hypothetical protein